MATYIPNLISSEIELFKHLNSTPLDIWQGKSPLKWATSVDIGLENRYSLPSSSLTRTALRSLWRDNSVPTEACVISTMAWGGMQYRHARKLWEKSEFWLPICDDVRAGNHTRRSGFESFSNLHKNGNTPGMGPAYFTKILFFACPKEKSFILDQWTMRSIHLLTGQSAFPPAMIDHASKEKALSKPDKLRVSVSSSATAEVYEIYCQRVEELAVRLGIHPHSVEEKLFSSGGRNPHPWREHVMNAWIDDSLNFYL